MGKQGQRAEVNTFIQGLITEASPLNFPPNASKEEENFVLNRDGTRHRRLGLDSLGPTISTGLSTTILDSGLGHHIWSSVNGEADTEILVVQLANRLSFHDLSNPYFPELGTLTAPFSPEQSYSFANIEGKLVVAGGSPTIFVVSCVSGVFSSEEISLKVRDFWGVEVV